MELLFAFFINLKLAFFINLIIYIVAFLGIYLLLVVVHELGHYLTAKFFNVKIDAFSIGFGKELLGFNDYSGTRWKISAVPAGGYVKMYGDVDETSNPDIDFLKNLPDSEKERAFYFKPLYQKFLIVLGGPMANFILAFLLLFYINISWPKISVEPIITELQYNGPAGKAGLKLNDKIIELEGKKITRFEDVRRTLALSVNKEISIKVLRESEEFTYKIPLKYQEIEDALGQKRILPYLGVSANKITLKHLGLRESAKEALYEIKTAIKETGLVISQIISRKRTVQDLGGPIKIAQYSGQFAKKGLFATIWFIGILSVSVGFINLLPIPLLDGGHLFLYIIEKILGNKIALKYNYYASRAGALLLISLSVFVIINDLFSLFKI